MKNDQSIEIERPIQDVFILANDHLAAWSSIVVEDEVVQVADDGGVGTRFRAVTEDRGHRMEFEGEVVEYAPPVRSAVHLRGPAFDLNVAYDLEELPDGRTRLTQISSSHGKGVWKVLLLILTPLMRKSARAATRKELEQLRAYCEAGTPATPGGPPPDTDAEPTPAPPQA